MCFQITAGLVTEQLLSALQFNNQLSVRYLIEWQVVLLLTVHPQLTADLFLPIYVCYLAKGWRYHNTCTCHVYDRLIVHVHCSDIIGLSCSGLLFFST